MMVKTGISSSQDTCGGTGRRHWPKNGLRKAELETCITGVRGRINRTRAVGKNNHRLAREAGTDKRWVQEDDDKDVRIRAVCLDTQAQQNFVP